MKEAVKEKVANITILNFAAVLALLIFTYMAFVHLTLAVQQDDAMAAFKDVVLWVIPIILNMLATYGLIERRNG